MYGLSLLVFKDVRFKFKSHACNECHDVSMAPYELKNTAILNVRRVDYRCILRGICETEAANVLNNFVLEDKAVF